MAKFQEIESAVVSLDKQVKILTKDLQLLINTVNNQSKSQVDLANKTRAVTKATTEIDAVEKQRLALLQQLKVANSDRIQKNVQLQTQLQQQKKTNKDLAREKLGLIGAYEKESKRLIELRKRYKDLAVAGKENTKESKKLRGEIGKLDSKLKGVDKTVGQSQRNVGNYGGALSSLPGPIGQVISSMKMLAKVILTTPIGWIIGALALAGKAVQSFFTSSEEGQDRWNLTMNKAKVVAGNFTDELAKLGKRLVGLVDEIKNSDEGFKGWAKSVGESARGAWNRFRDDVKEEGFWDTVKGRAEDTYDTIKGKIAEVQAENQREFIIAEDIAKRQNKLNKDERSALVQTANLRQQIAELRAKAADKEGTTANERINLLDKAIMLENEVLSVNEKIANEKINLIKIENTLSGTTREDYAKLAQAEADLINLQTANAEKRRRFTSEQQTAVREANAEEKKFWDEYTADAEAIIDELDLAEDEAHKKTLARIKEEDDAKNKSANAELERQKEIEEAKKEIKEAAIDAAGEIAIQAFDNRIDTELEKSKAQADADIEILKNQLDKGLISEAQFEKKSKAIKLKVKQDEAKAEKKKALFDIAVATAVGIAKAIPNPVAMTLAAILGGIQAAVVAAKPIPKFKHGSNGQLQLDTTAIVGDGGKPELITTPGGSFLSPATDTMVTLPRGSQVFSGDSPETKAALSGGMTTEMYNGLIESNTRIERAVRAKQHTPTWTRKGLKVRDEIRNSDTIWIDKYMR